MGRPFDDDVRDVGLAQSGDGAALARLLSEYEPNLRRVAKKFAHVVGEDDAVQEARLGLIQHILDLPLEKACYLRAQVSGVASNALNESVSLDGLGRWGTDAARRAHEAMRHPVSVDEPDALRLSEAAAEFEVSPETILSYAAAAGRVSLDGLIEQGVDDENPEGVDLAGCRDLDDDALPVTQNPEFMRPGEEYGRVSVADSVAGFDVPDDSGRGVSVDARVLAVLDLLPARQREVLTLLSQGMSETDIADDLGLAFRTVVNHRARGFERVRELLDLTGNRPVLSDVKGDGDV